MTTEPTPIRPEPRYSPAVPVTNKTGPIVTLTGAGLAIIGALLPWATVSSVFGTVSVTGTDGDGVIVLVVSAIIALLATLELTSRSGRELRIGSALLAALVGIVALVDYNNIADHVASTDLEGVGVATIGVGLYVVLLGAAVAFIGALIKREQT